MKRTILLSIILAMFLMGSYTIAQTDTSITLTGNQTYTIEDSSHVLNGFEINGSSILTIKNADIMMMASSYTVSNNAVLFIENSTMQW